LDWYDEEAPGIGPRFLDEFEALKRRLSENPNQFPIVGDDIRRAAFHRFPYGLFFRQRNGRVEVIACLHASRDPRHWQTRH